MSVVKRWVKNFTLQSVDPRECETCPPGEYSPAHIHISGDSARGVRNAVSMFDIDIAVEAELGTSRRARRNTKKIDKNLIGEVIFFNGGFTVADVFDEYKCTVEFLAEIDEPATVCIRIDNPLGVEIYKDFVSQKPDFGKKLVFHIKNTPENLDKNARTFAIDVVRGMTRALTSKKVLKTVDKGL